MSKLIAELLGKPQKVIASAITELETMSGNPSEDVRFLAENSHKLRQKLTHLGLDPNDTTSEELYHALLSRYQNDSSKLDLALGVDSQAGFDKRVDVAIELTKQLMGTAEVWALKPAKAKNLLKQNKPKALMKLFNYRSVESMVKHENIDLLLLVAPATEGSAWQKRLAKQVSTLSSFDYSLRKLRFVKLTNAWMVHKPLSALWLNSKLSAAVGVYPSAKLQNTSVLNLSLLLIDAIEDLGQPVKHEQVFAWHPSLNWWFDALNLVAPVDGDAVSMNLRDTAKSHMLNKTFTQRSLEHARGHFWKELVSRYQQHLDSPAVLEDKIDQPKHKASNSLMPLQLAMESVTE